MFVRSEPPIVPSVNDPAAQIPGLNRQLSPDSERRQHDRMQAVSERPTLSSATTGLDKHRQTQHHGRDCG